MRKQMNPFEKAQDQLAETISLVSQCGDLGIEQALNDGRGRLAIAVGAGPFLAAAHYFARCRTTLGLGISLVMTPMEFVLYIQDMADTDIWLFGGVSDDPDMRAAIRAATAKSCRSVWSITTHPVGAITAPSGGNAISLPVKEAKDRLLAIHSVIAIVSALLFASDGLTERPLGSALAQKLISATAPPQPNYPSSGFKAGDTVILLYDPQLMPIVSMLETCLWQVGIVPVHRTDFGEFARYQYLWSSLHPESTFFLALTTCESEFIWEGLRVAIAENCRGQTINCGDGGRLASASGMLTGQAFLSHILRSTNSADDVLLFVGSGEEVGCRGAMEELAASLTPAVIHKSIARQLHDPVSDEHISLCTMAKQRLQRLKAARFVGITLDYDGTIVPNQPAEARLGPPPQTVVDQLVRLADDGILIGIATGRGSSAGARMREALPERLHSGVLIGYFNGAFIRTLDFDISTERPEKQRRIAEVADWIASSRLVRPNTHIYAGSFQVTVLLDDIFDLRHFVEQMAACPAIAAGDMRLVRSLHSFDIITSETTKLAVAHGLADRSSKKDGQILAIGDSGSPNGNDYELLLQPHAISVDRVCGDSDGTWSLFGHQVRGPAALQRILQSIGVKNGAAFIDIEALGLS
jgi:hydroxymethylpyrimidine pyrophosphatase-like HAD family hydrolase